MKKKLIKIARSQNLQPFWEKLNDWSKVGMNYWGGARWNESGELPAFENLLKKLDAEPIIIFDVGANQGKYAQAVYDIVTNNGKNCKYHCFEPVSSTFNVLSENLNGNNSAILNNFGLGDRENELEIFIPFEGSGLSSVFNEHLQNEAVNKNITETIKIRTLDDYCNENDVSLIHFLKIDVEGFELNVLEGARQLIDNDRILAIQFEFGESMIDAKVFFKDFWKLLSDKYTFYRILTNGLREIKEYSESLEVFHCVNFLAIHKTL